MLYQFVSLKDTPYELVVNDKTDIMEVKKDFKILYMQGVKKKHIWLKKKKITYRKYGCI